MKLTKDKAYSRDIKVSAYPVDENRIAVVGELIDDRKKDFKLITGEWRGAGKIHHMIIRLLINTNEMTIDDVELEILTVPREECHVVKIILDKLIGLKITHGFSDKVRHLLGGIKGCTHQINLLIAMGPAIMQGLWSVKAQESSKLTNRDELNRKKTMVNVISNTCYVWREDGPSLKQVKDIIEEQLKNVDKLE